MFTTTIVIAEVENSGSSTPVEEGTVSEPPQVPQEEPSAPVEKPKKKDDVKKETSKQSVDTGTMPVTQTEDVSSEEKYNTYGSYENATLKKGKSATFRMAQLYFKDGLYERAVNLAKKDVALKEGEQDISLMYVVAIGSRLMGNFDQSVTYYDKILSQGEAQPEALLGIAIAYKGKGDFAKALKYLNEYEDLNSTEQVQKEIKYLNEVLASS